MSYSTSGKGKGGAYYQQQHPQQRPRYPGPRPEDPRQPRFTPQPAQRPQHPGPSQSPRIPSPSVSPVAVNTLPHDMNKQGAPNRPGMAASPQQGILPNQPQPQPAMMSMNQVRYPAPRQVQPRFTQPPMPQQVYPVRHQSTAHMQGIQHHPQAGGPQAQQGANAAQLMQPNAATAGQYMQAQGAPYTIMTGPMPIVQGIPHRPYHQQSYATQVYQQSTPPFYSSPPQPVWLNTQPAPQPPRQQFTPQPMSAARPETQRNKKIIRIVDPSTNQDVTDTLMRDASGSNSPISGRSSANVTPPVSTSSEDAKRIQAQFAKSVAMVASEDIPTTERPPAQQSQVQQPQQPPPPQLQHGMQHMPLQQQKPPVQQQVNLQPMVPVGQPVATVGGLPGKPGVVPTAVPPQGQPPNQPVESSLPDATQVIAVAATPSGEEASQPQQLAPLPQAPQPVPQGGAPIVAVVPDAVKQQPVRAKPVPVQQNVPSEPTPVATQPPPPAAQPTPPAAQPTPPAAQPTPPAGQSVPAPIAQTLPLAPESAAKGESPVVIANQDATLTVAATSKAPAAEQAAPKAETQQQPATEAQPVVSSDSQEVDSRPVENAESANTPSVQPQEPASAVSQAQRQESTPQVEAKDNKKKSQKKRMQEIDKKAVKDSDELAAFKTEDAHAEPATVAQDNKEKEEDSKGSEVTIPKEVEAKGEDEPSDKPQTSQQEEEVKSEKTEDVLSDVAKRKTEDNVSEETAGVVPETAGVVPETTPAKLDEEEKVDHNEADDRENVNENEIDNVESENSKNREGKPNPKDNKIQLKYTYRDDQWSPVNPEGKKQYDRDFLLQFQKGCTDKPDGLPHIPDIVLDKADVRPLGLNLNQGANPKNSDFMPHFMKSPRPQGKQPNFQQGQGRRASREPLKVIQRVRDSTEAKLNTSDKAWKPGHKRQEDQKEGDEGKTEELFRNFKSILNKLAPQRFQKLVEQAQQLPIDTEERLTGVIQLVFEKAISEPGFSTAYAHMCQRLSQLKVQSTSKPGKMVQFRPILLSSCQREFEKDSQADVAEAARRKEIAQLPADQRTAKLEELEEQLMKAKRRTMGNIRFIGELYKLRILTENIMHDCIIRLMKAKDEESYECLCNLMSTIGKDLDHDRAKNRMDQYFIQIDKIIQGKKTSPRIRFLMCDLLDLRRSKWIPRRQEAKPTTIDAIHREFNAQEAKKADEVRTFNRSGGRSREQAAPPPRTGPPQADDGWNTVSSSKSRPVYDPAKLKLTRMQADDNVQLGPGGRGFNMWTRGSLGGSSKNQSKDSAAAAPQDDSAPTQANRFSMLSEDSNRQVRGSGFGSRDSRGRGQSPSMGKHSSRERERERDKEAAIAEVQKLNRGRSSHSLEKRRDPGARGSRELPPRPKKQEEPVMTDDKVEQTSKAIVDEFLNLRDFKEATRCVSELPSKQRHLFVQSTLDHIIEKTQDMREAVGVLFQSLITSNILTNEQYLRGLSGILEFAEDMAIDIPKIWEYLGQIQGAMLKGGPEFLKLQASAIKPLCEMNKAGILLAEIMKTAARRIGANAVCRTWQESGLQWENFLPPQENVQEFVKAKGVEFTLDGAKTADNGLNSADSQGDWLRVVNRGLTNLLKEKIDNNAVMDWIENEVTAANKEHHDFIRALVTIICQSTAEGEGQTCRIEPQSLKKRCIVLKRYIDNKRSSELQALYAVQALNHSLQSPPRLLGIIFDVLYDEDVISEDAFYDWRKSEDPREQSGKGVALKSVTSFFTWLTEAEAEAD